MGKSRISRRRFVGTAAVGVGSLTLASASRLFAGGSSSMVSTLKNVWIKAKEYTLEFAQSMPGDKYGFKPTPEVFSYADQLLHLAGSNYWFFATLRGEKPPKPEEEFKSEGKTKEDVVRIVEESFAYGDEFFNGLTDAVANEEVSVGKNKLIKWKVALFSIDHLTHHRGQLVVYLRLNGIKPPEYRSGFFG
ncbi:MAG: DinB family protein [Candidatus Aminicenantes bacterium]|nr:DinB family protein [Candidatus Aminicenantes bacterium]